MEPTTLGAMKCLPSNAIRAADADSPLPEQQSELVW
jgi:hypothetical protein